MELKDSMYWYFVSFIGTNKPYPMQYNLLLFNIMIDRLANCVNRVIAKLIPLIRTRRLHPRVCSSSYRWFHPITMIWKTILYLLLHYHYPRAQHTIYHSSESESMRANWTDDLRHSVYIYIYVFGDQFVLSDRPSITKGCPQFMLNILSRTQVYSVWIESHTILSEGRPQCGIRPEGVVKKHTHTHTQNASA